MFTGIIEELGKVETITQNKISIKAKVILSDINLGDSIAVNGVCLTVTKINPDSFIADISPETIKVTALENLKVGLYVNLERALKVSSRLGGHIVSGHVDSIARIREIKSAGDFYFLNIELPAQSLKYVVKKGSVTVDGISLTIADINGNSIKIAVIPHTFENTNLKFLKTGDFVNIETDILAKYVEKFLSTSDNKSRICMDFLKENGF